MLVINRFRESTEVTHASLAAARELLAAREGCLEAGLWRNLDEPGLWSLVTRWRDVGSYRRALSSYEVKLHGVPILSRAIEEPSAYEDAAGELNRAVPRDLGGISGD